MNTCSICERPIEHVGLGVGYGVDNDDNKVCYVCCGNQDSEKMHKEDKITLYLSKTSGKWYVSNWPGTLKFPATVSVRKRGHYSPFCGYMERRDAHFEDKHGNIWHGRSMGNWTEILHCKKVKSKRAIESARWWLRIRGE